jgi:hypothetical protein
VDKSVGFRGLWIKITQASTRDWNLSSGCS